MTKKKPSPPPLNWDSLRFYGTGTQIVNMSLPKPIVESLALIAPNQRRSKAVTLATKLLAYITGQNNDVVEVLTTVSDRQVYVLTTRLRKLADEIDAKVREAEYRGIDIKPNEEAVQ